MDAGSDDESEEVQSWKGSAGSIILINITGADKEISKLCLQSTCELIRETLKASMSQVIGVCLFGTKETKINSAGLQNIIELVGLDNPTLQNLKDLRNVDLDEIESAPMFSVSEVLWYCARMFTNCKRTLSERTVFFMSTLDWSPSNSDCRPTLKRAVDLKNLGINLRLINVSKHDYQVNPFFIELMRASGRISDAVKTPPILNDVSSIITQLQQRSHKHLATSRLLFQIGDDFSVSVGVHKLCRTQSTPKTENLHSETNEAVTKNRQILKTERSSEVIAHTSSSNKNEIKETPLLKSEIVYYYRTGDVDVEFTNDEIVQLRKAFGSPSLKLLGFKPQTHLRKEKWFLKSCAFLFPNESAIEGSTKVFKALHKACIDCGVIAICTLCTRVNAIPKLVALFPVENPLGLDVDLGFDIIYIPYLENIKDVPVEETTEELDKNFKEFGKIDHMIDLLVKLKVDYNPKMFGNPKLQSLYRTIDSLALEEENSDDFVDSTKPPSKLFEEVDSDAFETIFGPFPITQSIKRPTQELNGGPPRKTCRDITEDDMKLFKSRIQSKQIEKYNVADLRKFLKHMVSGPLPALTGMKKNELVQQVYEKCHI